MTSYQIEGPWPGRLAIIPRPRGGEWLEDEALTWKAQGFDVVVSLLTKDEIAEFDLASEADLVRAQGMLFSELPIPDLRVRSHWRPPETSLVNCMVLLSTARELRSIADRESVDRA